jgi:signal transduction histidine kinase
VADRRGWWWRLVASVRLRSALLPAVVVVLVFGGGAWWQRSSVYSQRFAAAESNADSESRLLASTYFYGDPIGITTSVACWAVLIDGGRQVLQGRGGLDGPLIAATVGSYLAEKSDYALTETLTVQADNQTDCFTPGQVTLSGMQTEVIPGRTVRAKQWEVDWTTAHPDQGVPPLPAGPDPAPQRAIVYVAVDPTDARAAVIALDRTLWFGVPLAVVLIGALGWVIAARALRPVEAMRRELADITARRLDRRVPVPPRGNELRRLALTTNQTLDRLQGLVEEQRRFVADAAHELRTPIAGVRNQLEVAVAHAGAADWPASAAAALGGAKRLQALVDDLLLLARPDTVAPLCRDVDLGALACEAVAERDYLDADGPVFTADVPARVVTVSGDESALARVLRNLMDNASRHGRAAACVRVWAEDGEAWLEVVDDGPGIPAEARDRIFGRFTRLDDARTRERGGIGLGLAIVRDIVTRHGGTVRAAESAAGARFVVRLPLRPAPAAPPAVTAAPPAPAPPAPAPPAPAPAAPAPADPAAPAPGLVRGSL